MLERKYEYGISTDSLGLVSSAQDFYDVCWTPLIASGLQDDFAVELLPYWFPPIRTKWGIVIPSFNRTKSFIKEAEKKGIPISGVHGGIGYTATDIRGKVLKRVMNDVIVPLDRLIDDFGGRLNFYILAHSDLLNAPMHISEDPKVKNHQDYLVYRAQNIGYNQLVLIENSTGENPLITLSRVKQLRDLGVNAGITHDFVHTTSSLILKRDYQTAWRLAIETNEIVRNRAIADRIPMMCHIPLGFFLDDSFPLTEVTDGMFFDLAQSTKDDGIRKVLEFQQGGIGRYITILPSQKTCLQSKYYMLFDRWGNVFDKAA